MFDTLKLKSPIGRSYNTNPDDVRKIKKALSGLGYYGEPEHGISPYPDEGLIRGIEGFQRDHGLRRDGVMTPDGETAQMLGSVVGGMSHDAHISPKEATPLKKTGGAGSVHPETGLLELSDDSKQGGSYIWRTEGDGKVRPSHAERDGKVFSWDNQPADGHPGEAPNCRCTSKDVLEEGTKCDDLKVLMEEAWARHDALQTSVLEAENDIQVSEDILRDLRAERSAIMWKILKAAILSRPKIKPSPGDALDVEQRRREIQRLLNRIDQIDVSIEIEERTLAEAKQKHEQLLREQEQAHQIALEYSRRYNACTAENG